jgi:TPR repeat protein
VNGVPLMSFSLSKHHRHLLIAILILVACVIFFARSFVFRSAVSEPVTTHISNEDRRELERRAANGDPAAQYGLTLYVDDPRQADELLQKAANAGYPPAVMTYATHIMSQNAQNGMKARTMLENIASLGYYRAIVELAWCVGKGTCGPASKKDALTWAIVAKLLYEQKRINRNDLEGLEQDIRNELSPQDISLAETNAKSIAAKIHDVTR